MVRPNLAGTRVVDIFDEINEDLRAERARALLKRYGVVLVIAAVLVVAGVAGWEAWRWNSQQSAFQVATTFLDAMRKGAAPAGADASTPSREEALREFSGLAASGPEGYRTLARLRAAALKVTAGDRPGALALLDQVSADTGADPLLRGLADLLWVQHQVDAGEPAAIEGRLAPLLAVGNPWRPMARESQAWLAIRTGKPEQARDILKQLQADTAAPDGVRARAGGLLTRLGEPAAPGTGG